MGAVKSMIAPFNYEISILHILPILIFNSGMSKRIYVLYSLKEFMVPRIYKTKATINKYIDENKKLEYKQFRSE